MVLGYNFMQEDKAAIPVEGTNIIECVDNFTYLGSVITPNSRTDTDSR